MKSKVALFALSLLASTAAVASTLGVVVCYPPGPTIWAFVMRFFGA
jgi:hypothetical protein